MANRTRPVSSRLNCRLQDYKRLPPPPSRRALRAAIRCAFSITAVKTGARPAIRCAFSITAIKTTGDRQLVAIAALTRRDMHKPASSPSAVNRFWPHRTIERLIRRLKTHPDRCRTGEVRNT